MENKKKSKYFFCTNEKRCYICIRKQTKNMKTYKITVTQEYADDFEEVVHVSNFKEAWKKALEQVV